MITANDSHWEPDGVTLQVRFCEGRAHGMLCARLLTHVYTPDIKSGSNSNVTMVNPVPKILGYRKFSYGHRISTPTEALLARVLERQPFGVERQLQFRNRARSHSMQRKNFGFAQFRQLR